MTDGLVVLSPSFLLSCPPLFVILPLSFLLSCLSRFCHPASLVFVILPSLIFVILSPPVFVILSEAKDLKVQNNEIPLRLGMTNLFLCLYVQHDRWVGCPEHLVFVTLHPLFCHPASLIFVILPPLFMSSYPLFYVILSVSEGSKG